jgi:cytoskeletal protein RodZ
VGTTTTPAVTATHPSPLPTSHAPVTTRPVTPPVTATTLPTTAGNPSGNVAQVPLAGVTVRLNLTGARSWFHVASSTGKTLFEGILSTGQTKDFTDPKEIRVIVGAPKAVDIVVNGKDIGTLPETGPSVGHIVFTPTSGKTAAKG